jgi:hypothetical protein
MSMFDQVVFDTHWSPKVSEKEEVRILFLFEPVAEPPPGLPGRVPGLAASTVYRLECLVVRLGS